MKDGFASKDRRIGPRRSVIWVGTLMVGDFDFDCRVVDISLGGARVRLKLPLKRGAEVQLDLPRYGDLPAKVSYHRDDSVGLNFAVPPAEIRKRLGDSAAATLGLD